MNVNKKKEVRCTKCDQGQAWLTKQQLETGVTTKKIQRAKCSCCKGKWWDCMTCYLEKEYGVEGE